jgi:hypothetical protein
MFLFYFNKVSSCISEFLLHFFPPIHSTYFLNFYISVNFLISSHPIYYISITYPYSPLRIRVRIGPPHPYVCQKRRLNEAVLRMRPEKPRSRVTVGVAR